MIQVKNIKIQRNKKEVLNIKDFQLNPGEIVALLGPNGAGKSTLLQTLAGELESKEGSIQLNNKNLNDWPLEQRAQMLAVLPQASPINFPLTVLEVVLLGRTPHQTTHDEDEKIAKQCLQSVDMEYAQDRFYSQLSGGERQRVQIARVLAQIINPTALGERYLLLDEPTSALDLAHQHLILRLLRTLVQQGIGVVVILHDLNLAMQYADRVILLQEGQQVANGKPVDVLTAESIEHVFNLPVMIIPHADHSWIAPLNS
jgi:iron complex transport system ATP-binding protein